MTQIPHTNPLSQKKQHAMWTVKPTRVNSVCVTGPLIHFDAVTDEQALSLGLVALPGPACRSTVRQGGIVARRLASGMLNVTVPYDDPMTRDPSFDAFMAAVTAPPPAEDPGRYDIYVPTWSLELSQSAFELGRVLNPALAPKYHFFEHFRHIHPDDLGRVVAGVTTTIAGHSDWEHVYRIGQTRVRTWGRATERDGAGRAITIVGGIVALTNQK